MDTFKSEIFYLGSITLPAYSGLRIMMMPFKLHDPRTVPLAWRVAIESMVTRAPQVGVGYLTIDEAVIEAGTTHRRPGLHVDGVGPGGRAGGWGGGGGWGKRGMLTAANVTGAQGWTGTFSGAPGPNGNCAHLAEQCATKPLITFESNRVYWCGPHAVHEALVLPQTVRRQFVRISMPSDAPWYEGYTPSPYGVQPTGPIHPERVEFMNFRRS